MLRQPTPRTEIRLLIADERKLLRQGLIALFTTEAGIIVVGEAADGVSALDLVKEHRPDVAVLNVRLPKLDGLSAGRRMSKSFPAPELVFLADVHHEAMMREVFRIGGRAYLLQDCEFKELVMAVRKAFVGDYYLTGPAGYEMVQEFVNPSESNRESDGNLTRREAELARLLAEGYSSKEAADFLNISIKTAENHRASIMKKLRARNVTDIVKYCIRNDLIEP